MAEVVGVEDYFEFRVFPGNFTQNVSGAVGGKVVFYNELIVIFRMFCQFGKTTLIEQRNIFHFVPTIADNTDYLFILHNLHCYRL